MPTQSQYEEFLIRTAGPRNSVPKYSAEEVRTLQQENPGYLIDSLRGVLGGIEGGLKSIFELGEGVGEAVTGVDLWNPWDSYNDGKRFTPETQTLVGGLVGGISQFAVGWVGGGLALKLVAPGLKAFSIAEPVSRAVTNLAAAGKSTQAAILHGMTYKVGQSALADFIAFSEDDARVSDLIQNSDYANPITELLAADQDDSMFEGRLKNVVEGLILGGVLDATVSGIQGALRRKRVFAKAIEEGLEPEAAMRRATTIHPVEPPEPPPVKATMDETGKVSYELPPLEKAVDEPPALVKRREAIAKDIVDMVDRGELNRTLQSVQEGLDTPAEIFPGGTLNQKFRDLPESTLRTTGIERNRGNFSIFKAVGDGDDALARLYDAAVRKGFVADPTNPNTKEAAAKVLAKAAEFYGATPKQINTLIAKNQLAPEQIYAAAQGAKVGEAVAYMASKELKGVLADVVEISDKAKARGPAVGRYLDTDTLREVVARYRQIMKLEESVIQTKSAFGWSLQSFGNPNIPKPRTPKTIFGTNWDNLETLAEQGITEANKAKAVLALKQIDEVMGMADPLDASKYLQKWMDAPVFNKSGQVLREYYMNSILSNPGSWVANAGGGLFQGAFLPLERMGGAKAAKLAGAIDDAAYNTLIAREMKTFTEFFTGLGEAWQIAKHVGAGDYIRRTKFDGFDQYSAIQLALKDKGSLGPFLANVLTFPSTVLNKTDQVMKISAYRARAKALLSERAVAEGIPPDAVDSFVRRNLELMTTKRAELQTKAALETHLPDAVASGAKDIADDLGKRLDIEHTEVRKLLDTHDQAVHYGEQLTWTEGLSKDRGFISGTGAMVSQWVRNYPALGFLIPFVRTPANIAQFAWDRSFGMTFQVAGVALSKSPWMRGMDLEGGIFRLARELQSADNAIKVDAVARVTTSMTFATSLAVAAGLSSDSSGLPILTGKGPTDKEERRALEEAGWQPYSIRFGGKYVSYQRFDPIASLLGMVADYVDVQQRMALDPSRGGLGIEEFGTAIVAAVARNITSKTYLQGLSDVVEIATGDDRKISAAIGSITAGFIPSVMAGQTGAVDPYTREIRSVLDRMMSRVPGLSDNLAPRRNILGEKVKRVSSTGWTGVDAFLPVRMSNVQDNVIAAEIAKLKFGFNIPGLVHRGIDLTDEAYAVNGQDAYDRYLELSGQVRIGGTDLRQALRKLIQSQEYQSFPDTFDELGNKSPRVDLINGVLSKYRRKAWSQLEKERPALRSAIREVAAARRRPTLY